ncbi:hypothetical protein COW80_04270 [Candidatus Beckwithbacteria bacterium CG22_combo_CG10-13_8_21_14_all_01_47_9]|uniref:Inositol monophosphatase n=3 Tax=Candidatus Beckwithiibacteriota TaxID=1752726 RepID=A0A2H0E0P2_9BACT|nr:MAG: hypothetical protein AUJ59_00690 [Candidatus Beckwithbacteria bacterium CG1_02_47_37]PIP87708.1 MAG: hypothetical protein COW80_04270 [Candidatus Beckwithbacteria bacterium CG22_combo_CG10-13_8_21_14_all_01_47_9]PJC66173.1 MAG: hypothetical protein CO018_03295 [Candidatus Beckwithbacteria bacterium CG_4_9_14_0_2_um_filter_47_11]
MDKNKAFLLFETMIAAATKKLYYFSQNFPLKVNQKADKTAVTQCDQLIDNELTNIAKKAGLAVVSEEGEPVLKIVQSGNYLTIDPIDGTLGYIDYANFGFDKDLGSEKDFCLLLGIVENNQPRFGAVFNYVTKEKIFLDAQDKNNFIRLNNKRNYSQKYAVYLDQRQSEDRITQKLLKMPEVSVIKQAALGLKSVYTIINPHQSAVTVHRVQTAGLWDILPAAVATKAFGGQVYDDLGQPLRLNQYIILPGNGATINKGEKFKFVIEKLK